MAKKAATTKRTSKKSQQSDIQELNLLTGEYFVSKPEEDNMDEFKIKKLGPFDILDMMFKEPQRFDALPDTQLEQFAFILNRRFALKYPMQAAQFSKMGINQAWVLRSWAIFLRRVEGTRGVPRFLYTKKAEESKKIGIDAFDDELIRDYMKRYELSKADFKDMLQFFNEETIAHVERFFKINSKAEQKKMFKSNAKEEL
jgi:hypothetical protein